MTFFIYKITNENNLDVMIIGDSVATGHTTYGNNSTTFNLYLKKYLENKNLRNYDINYTKNNTTITDISYKLIKNNKIDNKNIQNIIKESEIIIIALGQDELVRNSQINNLKNIDRRLFYEEYKQLLKNIRKITQKPIYVIGFFGPNINHLTEIENNIKLLCSNNDVTYISVKNVILEDNYADLNFLHLNTQGYKKIFNALTKELSL